MRLGTRLLATLLPTVAGIMTLYAVWALRQRETTVLPEARQETDAYATALVHALEYAFRDPAGTGVQEIIDEISRQPKIYGVLIYDSVARPRFVSDPLVAPTPAPDTLLARVLVEGAEVGMTRALDDREVYSVFRPIRARSGQIRAVLEVAQPLDFVTAEKARIRQRFVLNTLTLLTALAIATLWLVRRSVTRPMVRMVEAARALGRGEGGRMPEALGARELDALAQELNRMVAQLEVANRSMRENEKMAALGTLAAGLAHEIAAPLNVISGRAELLQRQADVSGEHGRQLRIIVEQISRITKIMRNLLDFARPREPRITLVDVATVVDRAIELLETEIHNADVTIERRHDRPFTAWGDADLLQQVFLNLLLNAIEAVRHADGLRRITIRGDAGSGTLEIADTGPGIPPDAVGRVFEPFYTTKPAGTGLGLVVARSIADAHGATLIVESTTGSGTVFRLTFPVTADA